MKGLKYIGRYLFRKVPQSIVVFIALVAVIVSTYFQVETPVKMGESITALSNYALVQSIQSNTDEALQKAVDANNAATGQNLSLEEFKMQLNALSDEQFNAIMTQANSSSSSSIDPSQVEAKTGFTLKELILGDVVTYDDLFQESLKSFLFFILLGTLATFVFSLSMAYVGTIASHYMRTDLFKKLQRLAIKFFDTSNDGDVLSIFTNDIDNIANLINQAMVQVISSLFLLISITYTMLKNQFTLGMIVLVLGGILLIFVASIMIRARKYVSQQQKKLGEMNGYIDEKISGQRVIITNGLEEETIKNFLPFNEAYRETSTKGQTYSGLLVPVIQGFALLSTALIILFGSRMAIDQVIEVGVLITFVQFSQRFFQPFNQISAQYSVIQLAISGAERVDNVLGEIEDVVTRKDAVEFSDVKKMVRLNNLHFGYDLEQEILKGISLDVEVGKMVAVVGPTGSGKTTIMNLLNRFYNVENDMIYYDDVDINDISVDSLRQNVGIVLQDSVLFTGTIRDNINYGNKNASESEIKAAAKLANIHDYIMSLDDGYDTIVSDSGSVLSTGQKQLISIARTILTNPKLLILDEATSNVDTVTEAKIQAAMDNVINNRTSFVIAHRLKTILNADVILVLQDGKIIQKGSHDELVHQDGLYSDLYHNQFVFE